MIIIIIYKLCSEDFCKIRNNIYILGNFNNEYKSEIYLILIYFSNLSQNDEFIMNND